MKRLSLSTVVSTVNPRRVRVVALAAAALLASGLVTASATPAETGTTSAASPAVFAISDRVADEATRSYHRNHPETQEPCQLTRPDGSCIAESPLRVEIVAQPAVPVPQPTTAQPKPPKKTDPKTTDGKKKPAGGGSGPSVTTGGGCAPAVKLPANVVSQIDSMAGSICDAAKWKWIVSHESGGRVTATNPSSGAYGLGQALPRSKMAPFGADYLTSAAIQLRWMLSYMKSRYGSIAGAYSFWRAHNWY